MAGDKPLTSTLLAEGGLPVPRFGAFDSRSYSAAQRFFDELPKPVVAKPARGTAGGAGITLGIRTHGELRAGFARARSYGREVLVEEQVAGENVRVTVLDGEVLGAVQRAPAHVVGDGSATIAALVEAKNALWRAGGPANRLFRPITLDADAVRVLKRQGLRAGEVPAAGRTVRLRDVSNADQGGEVIDVRAALHPQHLELALAAARIVGPVLCGVDLIVADLAAPGRVFVNEVNTTPSLYVAGAIAGGSPSTDAAEAVLRYVFGMSR
jgi:cyanophycin synthetase